MIVEMTLDRCFYSVRILNLRALKTNRVPVTSVKLDTHIYE